jgi:hypothetical protein
MPGGCSLYYRMRISSRVLIKGGSLMLLTESILSVNAC